MGVQQLHECRLVHSNLSLKFFKVSPCAQPEVICAHQLHQLIMHPLQIFPIDEPPSHTNLRVKLVSLKHAQQFTTALSQRDVLQLGLSMCAVAIGRQACTLDSYRQTHQLTLQSYDVPLSLLVNWMIEGDPCLRATIADVVRHPYFMGTHETEAFALALHGGLFEGEGLVANGGFERALGQMSVVLMGEMAGMFDALRAEPELCDDDGDDGDGDGDGDADADGDGNGDGGDGGGGGECNGEYAVDDDDDDNGPCWAFAVAAHKFLVSHGFINDSKRINLAGLCNPTAKLTLYPNNLMLIPESERSGKKAKGYLRRMLQAYPAIFTVVEVSQTVVEVYAAPLGAFAFKAHKFLVANGHVSAETAVNVAQVCDPDASPTLHPNNVMLVPPGEMARDPPVGYLTRTFRGGPRMFGVVEKEGVGGAVYAIPLRCV